MLVSGVILNRWYLSEERENTCVGPDWGRRLLFPSVTRLVRASGMAELVKYRSTKQGACRHVSPIRSQGHLADWLKLVYRKAAFDTKRRLGLHKVSSDQKEKKHTKRAYPRRSCLVGWQHSAVQCGNSCCFWSTYVSPLTVVRCVKKSKKSPSGASRYMTMEWSTR